MRYTVLYDATSLTVHSGNPQTSPYDNSLLHIHYERFALQTPWLTFMIPSQHKTQKSTCGNLRGTCSFLRKDVIACNGVHFLTQLFRIFLGWENKQKKIPTVPQIICWKKMLDISKVNAFSPWEATTGLHSKYKKSKEYCVPKVKESAFQQKQIGMS